MFEVLQFIKSSNKLRDSQLLAEYRLGLEKKRTAKLVKTSTSHTMPPPKKEINPSSDSHNSKFAIVNYESNSQVVDEHTETANSTFNISSIHWTDALEIILIGAAGLFIIRYIRKFLKKRREREEAQRQARLLSTIQGSIPLSPHPVNPSFASAPVPMIEDKSTQNTRGSRPSSFRIYEP